VAEAAVAALRAVEERGGHGGAIVLGADGSYATVFDTRAMARGRRDRSGTRVALFEDPQSGDSAPRLPPDC
jgi:hypothetical protein